MFPLPNPCGPMWVVTELWFQDGDNIQYGGRLKFARSSVPDLYFCDRVG